MNHDHDTGLDEALKKSIVEALDKSVDHLDASTLSHLNLARQRALEQATRPRMVYSHWLKAATVAVLLVTLINGWMFFSSPNIQHANTDEIEMLLANEDFELAQDLDFIAWMIEQDHAG